MPRCESRFATLGVTIMILFIIPHGLILKEFADRTCEGCYSTEPILFILGLLIHILMVIPETITVMQILRRTDRYKKEKLSGTTQVINNDVYSYIMNQS